MKNEIGFKSEKKEKFKQKYPIVTDKDLRFQEGRESDMVEMLSFKLGKTNQEILRIIIEL